MKLERLPLLAATLTCALLFNSLVCAQTRRPQQRRTRSSPSATQTTQPSQSAPAPTQNSSIQNQAARETMTNATVIELVRLGLSDAVIIEKIKQSSHSFDTSVAGLKQLKAARVSDAIIMAIMNPSNAAAPPATAAPRNTATSAAVSERPLSTGASSGRPAYPLPPDKGAYLWDGTTLHLLYQSTVPSVGQNFLRSMIPFARKKMELQLIGANAKARFNNSQPTILVSGLGEVIPGVPAFRWLYVKTGGMLKDRRIVGTYDVGGFFGSMRMVDNEIECETRKLGDGIYAITPVRPLPDGEYGLAQVPKLAELPTNRSFAPPIWDFGIYAAAPPTAK